MAWNVPSISSLIAQFLSNIEQYIGQKTPLGAKAYNRVMATAQGMQAGGLYRFAISQAQANLAITGKGSQLDQLGSEFGLSRNRATQAVVQINVPATDGTVIFVGFTLTGPNNLLYRAMASATAPVDASGSGATALFQCVTAGPAGNIGVGAQLTILNTIAGASSPAVVTSITATGCVTAVDTEGDPSYSQRILAIERAYGGGGNGSDYRTWAESVLNVANAYPYAGLPYYGALSSANEYAAQVIEIIGSPTGGTFTLTFNGQTSAAIAYNTSAATIQAALNALTGATTATVTLLSNIGFLVTGFSVFAPIVLGTNSLTGGTSPTVYVIPNAPPARTIYVESTIDTNGIANATLIASVVTAIQYNANTGLANQPTGLSMSSLFVVPIIRTGFYVQITSLQTPTGQTATVKATLQTALAAWFLALTPFVDGVDPTFSRTDLITQPSLAAAVGSVLSAYGASCQIVGFGPTSSSYLLTYQLGQGEKAQMLGLGYV